jgi:hypothetical protein
MGAQRPNMIDSLPNETAAGCEADAAGGVTLLRWGGPPRQEPTIVASHTPEYVSGFTFHESGMVMLSVSV